MGNIIYDLKIVNEKIREDLKREFPNLLFSVSKDSRSIYVALVSGNIKPFRALTDAEKDGYTQVNHFYINDDASLSEEGKSVMKKVKDITDNYNYDKSDPSTDYFDKNFYLRLRIGKNSTQPYIYKASKKSSSRSTTQKADTSKDDLLYDYKTWKLYKRYVGEKVVFVLIKNKETPTNREAWLQIKIDINIASGMKWNPKYQHFDKWDRLSEDAIFELEKVINKYYPTQKSTESNPQPNDDKSKYEEEESNTTPSNGDLKQLIRTFATPSDVTNKELRMDILNTLETSLDNSYEYFKEKPENWLKDFAPHVLNNLEVVDKDGNLRIYNLLDGINLDFDGASNKRATKRNILARIIDISGNAKSSDIIYGVMVSVPGEANTQDGELEKYEKERAQEESRNMYFENTLIGGTLGGYDWHSLYRTVKIAKNYLNDEFEASFKYPQFTQRFRDEVKSKDVVLDDEDYKGNPTKNEARLNIVSNANKDKFIYILEQGGYSGLYSNSWYSGKNMLYKLKDVLEGYLSYVKDIDPFGTGLTGAKEFLPQLMELAPDLFPKKAIVNEREVIQQQIDDLELLLKVSHEMSEEDKKVILSQVLDLHTLLNLI